MTDESSTDKKREARRRLLKLTAVGGVSAALLPEQWTRPIMNMISVPAHAATTGTTTTTTSTSTTTTTTTTGGGPTPTP